MKREREIDIFNKIVREKGLTSDKWGIDAMRIGVLIKGRWYPNFALPEKIFREVLTLEKRILSKLEWYPKYKRKLTNFNFRKDRDKEIAKGKLEEINGVLWRKGWATGL